MENSNILYIPIQINGGSGNVPSNLLERELFIKDGVLYVGNGDGTNQVIVGRVIPNAVIDSPKIKGKLYVEGEGIVVTKESFEDSKSSYADGRIVFIDEGEYQP